MNLCHILLFRVVLSNVAYRGNVARRVGDKGGRHRRQRKSGMASGIIMAASAGKAASSGIVWQHHLSNGRHVLGINGEITKAA